MPLAGLRIEAVGDAVVVSEGASQWRPDDGQYVLQFEVASPGGQLAFMRLPVKPGRVEPEPDWFGDGVALESQHPQRACEAYRHALDRDPCHRDAYINLGRLLHDLGVLAEAEDVYREGLKRCGDDVTLLFNLAVLQEDLGKPRAAIESYRAALSLAPDLVDAHFNLARVCEANGLQQEALRHWSAFRKLSGRK
jgi:tetratricopeptide (TPR) repeat protein